MTDKLHGVPDSRYSTLKDAGLNAHNIEQAVEAGNENQIQDKIADVNGFGSALASRIVFQFK